MEDRNENSVMNSETQSKNTAKRDIADELFDWIDAFATSLVFVLIFFTLICKLTKVVGESMIQTLQPNDKLVISNLNYTPSDGDVIVAAIDNQFYHEPIVKRVIAVAGETVNIDFYSGKVYVTDRNGVTRQLVEDYCNTLTTRSYDVEFPLTVPEGYLFVMGDNRNGSTDSRDSRIGLVDTRAVMGKVLFRLLPLSGFGKV